MYLNQLLKRTFIRQSSEADCGLACLAMILNYSGRADRAHHLRSLHVPPNGLSLLELREMAANYQMDAQCVEMEVTFLRTLESPCILLVKNDRGENHFVVCYGGRRRGGIFSYWIADPAKQFYQVDEKQILEQWESRAALYFFQLERDLSAFRRPNWLTLLLVPGYPRAVWALIPLLTLFSTISGICLTWLLQKGMTDHDVFSWRIAVPLLLLLLLVNLFKSFFSFIRQRILIMVNLGVNRYLMCRLLRNLFTSTDKSLPTVFNVKNGLKDIQKMQNALSALIATIISDGFLLILLLSGATYLSPYAGAVNMVMLLVAGMVSFGYLPAYFVAYSEFFQLSAFAENHLVQDAERLQALKAAGLLNVRKQYHHNSHQKTLQLASTLAGRASTHLFVIEVLATINVVLVVGVHVPQVQAAEIPYESFMLAVVFTYLMGTLFSRLHNAVQIITEGAEACLQYFTMTGGRIQAW